MGAVVHSKIIADTTHTMLWVVSSVGKHAFLELGALFADCLA